MRVFRSGGLAFLLMVSFLFIGGVRAEVKEGVYGDWKVKSWTDDFTDEYQITAINTFDNAGVDLIVRCSNRASTSFVALGGLSVSGLNPAVVMVDLRVDKKKPISINGVLFSEHFVLLPSILPSNSVGIIIQQMKKGNKVVLRITDGEGNKTPIFRVSLKGFSKAYEHLGRDCINNRFAVYGKWSVSTQTNEFIDEYQITAFTIIGSGAIAVSCHNSDKPYIFSHDAGLGRLRPGKVSVDLRVDKKNPISGISGTLIVYTDGDRLVAIDYNSIAMIIQQMREGENMILRITDEKDNKTPTYKFSLKGFTKAYNHVVRDCKRKQLKKTAPAR